MCGGGGGGGGGGGRGGGSSRVGSCSSVEVEDAGLGWRAELVREGVAEVCVGGSRVGVVVVLVGGGGSQE